MTPPQNAGWSTENFESDSPAWTPTPDEQAAAVYVPHRGSISKGARVGPVEGTGTDEPSPPPLYDGAPIVYLNEGDDGFDEIRAAIDLVDESGSPDEEPSEDEEPPEDDPPPLALRFPVPEDEEEGEDDELDALRPTG